MKPSLEVLKIAGAQLNLMPDNWATKVTWDDPVPSAEVLLAFDFSAPGLFPQ